ncbi:MAG TPA: DUF1304 domain-containing protein [Gammaproteobacteria bacterium]|nr:DUF1304 domain-containing protein [Gammaproteobacteria bacterium]
MLAKLSIALVAALHVLFMILEMLLWNTPFGRRIFGLTREQSQQTAVLAANQGLYNGFLAAGLLWGLYDPAKHISMIVFFLVCVVVAGVFGSITANRSILWIQALPGLIALGLVQYAGL